MRGFFETVLVHLKPRWVSSGIRASSQSGFTLLEMLVALAIVAILSSVAIPRIQAYTLQQQVNTAARELAQSIETARINAQSFERKVKICPVAAADLNAVLPNCDTSLSSNDRWEAWVVLALDANDLPVRVLTRGIEIPAQISISTEALAADRIITELGAPRGVTGFTIKVKALSQPNIGERTIKLAPFSGRVTFS